MRANIVWTGGDGFEQGKSTHTTCLLPRGEVGGRTHRVPWLTHSARGAIRALRQCAGV